jgi:ABC-type nitrate/sulfonate/bicarbonate transport system permease component
VFARIAADLVSGSMAREAGWTLYRVAVGFTIASVVGAVIGTLMSRVRAVRWFFDPVVSIGFPVPKISFLPIFVLWFGLFDLTKIMMAVIACVFPVITATWAGTQGVDRYLIWSAQNFGAKRQAILWEVILPAALPQVFTGLQVALPIAFIVVTVTEMLTGGSGLGGAMITGARYADSPRVFANLIAVGALGYIAMKILEFVRRRALVWHEEVQRASM